MTSAASTRAREDGLTAPIPARNGPGHLAGVGREGGGWPGEVVQAGGRDWAWWLAG